MTGLAERARRGGLSHRELGVIYSAPSASVAVSERFWRGISVLDLVAELTQLAVMAERALEVGLSQGELEAIHSASNISLDLSEKFSGQISVLELVA